MSFTYTEKPVTPLATAEADFVPAYARRPARQKKFRTWMVLAPIGALALIGGAAAIIVGPDATDAAPLVEPAPAMAPVLDRTAPLPTTMSSPPVAASTPAPVAVTAAPARVAREATPVRQTAPARRAAPVVRAAPASSRVETPVVPAGVRPYSPATSSMNAAPTTSANTPAATPAPAPAAPAITVQPLN